MSSNFLAAFMKTAQLGERSKTAAGPIGSAVKYLGKKAVNAVGGPFGAALTGLGMVSDMGNVGDKMQKAREGLL